MKRTHFHRGASQFYEAEAEKTTETMLPLLPSDRPLSAETDRSTEEEGQILGNQPDTNRIPTGYQPDINKAATGYQPDTNRIPTRHHKSGQPDTNQITTGYQPDNNRIPNLPFCMLVGLQRKIVLVVYESSRSSGGQVSLPLSLDYLRASTTSTTGAIKVAIHRLKGKRILTTQESKKCRGGWTRYRLADSIFLDLQNSHPDTNQVTTGSQPDNNRIPIRVSQRVPTPLSSSSYISTNYTPTTKSRAEGGADWSHEDLDYSMLTDIGFGRSQVLQLRTLGIPFDVLQRSLVYFDFELRHTASGKSIQEPLALLMKRLRQNGCWVAPEEYEKRVAHFQTLFAEREQQVAGSAPIDESTSEQTALPMFAISPFAAEQIPS